MAKSLHTPEFRVKVSQEYFDGRSYLFLAEKDNIGKTTLQQWVAKYRLYGIAAFIKTAGNFSSREVLRSWIMRYKANRELTDCNLKREVYMAESRRKTTIEERRKIVA